MDAQVANLPPPPPPPPPPPAFFAETPSIPPPPPPPPVSTPAQAPVTSTQDRVWLHPWTSAEMRQYASQWSLAGDSGLLLHLEQFSDRLVQRAEAIQQHLSQTVNAVKTTHTRVQNSLNEFIGLANTQFIENRVYDDDDEANDASAAKKEETTNEKNPATTAEAQEKVFQRYVEALQYGLAVLDTHFEHVEAKMENGDSTYLDDDDDDRQKLPMEPFLEPKDPYILRPLPHLIGTTEFMQNDDIGLGDSLFDPNEPIDEPIESSETESDMDSPDEEDSEPEAPPPAPILVPAGASQPEIPRRPTAFQPTMTYSDNDSDDDPFGSDTTRSTFKPSVKEPEIPTVSEQPPPSVPTSKLPEKGFFESDDDNDENQLPPNIPTQSKKDSDSEPEPKEETNKPKTFGGVSIFGSDLAAAIAKRARKIGDPDAPPAEDSDDDSKKTQKPTKTHNDKMSSTAASIPVKPKTVPQPPNSTTSIFPKQTSSDEEEDPIIFGPNKPPTTSNVPKLPPPPAKNPSENIFDKEDSDDDDYFKTQQKPTPVVLPTSQPSTVAQKSNQPSSTNKHKPVPANISDDDSDDFGIKNSTSKTVPPPVKPTPHSAVVESSDSDDGFLTIPSKASKLPQTTTAPVNKSTTITPATSNTKSHDPFDEDGTDSLFEEPKPIAAPIKPPVVAPVASNPAPTSFPSKPPETSGAASKKLSLSSDEELFPSKTKPQPQGKSLPPVKNNLDDDDDVFSSATARKDPKLTTPVLTTVTVDTTPASDPLSIIKVPPVEPIKPIVNKPPAKQLSDSEEELPTKKAQNPNAIKEGQKLSVKDLVGVMKIPVDQMKPRVTRPKAVSITEEPPSPPPVVEQKKPSKIIPDSDDDDDDELFKPKKTELPKQSLVKVKEPTSDDDETKTDNIKSRATRLKIEPRMPGTPPTPVRNDEQGPSASTTEPPKEISAADKAMSNIQKDRVKAANPNRRPPTRAGRLSTPATATEATASNDTDDLFGVSTSTPTITISNTPRPSAPAAEPIVVAPTTVATPTTSTGLFETNASAAAAATAKTTTVKEKKKVSLFDSDDSDIDALLFGSDKKKKATSSATKPNTTTTAKAAVKPSLVLLDDDDNDFLSKRPVRKSTKAANFDDIFADDKSKAQPVNKAKKDWSILDKSTDDLFNDAPTPSSKSSTTSKPKTKTSKDFDDIFDDPLSATSKR